MGGRGLLKAITGITLAIGLFAQAQTVAAQAPGAAASPPPSQAKPVRMKPGCTSAADRLKPKCRVFAQAEPKIVPFNGFFQYVWLPFVAGSGAITAASAKNSKNCGNGNNNNTGNGNGNQNNGNCPASP